MLRNLLEIADKVFFKLLIVFTLVLLTLLWVLRSLKLSLRRQGFVNKEALLLVICLKYVRWWFNKVLVGAHSINSTKNVSWYNFIYHSQLCIFFKKIGKYITFLLHYYFFLWWQCDLQLNNIIVLNTLFFRWFFHKMKRAQIRLW